MPWTKNGVWYDGEIGLRPASPRTLDFSGVHTVKYKRDEDGLMRNVLYDDRPSTGKGIGVRGSAKGGMLNTGPQIRARARRARRRGMAQLAEVVEVLYKPLDEWDDEELARGRPRCVDGTFKGVRPAFVTREIHEEALNRFRTQIKSQMNVSSLTGTDVINKILEDDEVDNRGKPVVAASTKLDAAKYLLDHVVGKPVQPTQADISVKLQAILANVMVDPDDAPDNVLGYRPAYVASIEGPVYDAEIEEEDDG